jgi:acyl carrier protein
MPQNNTEARLRAVLAEATSVDTQALGIDVDLVVALNLDSLAGLGMLAAVEKRFDVRFPDHQLNEFRTIRVILDFIRTTQPGVTP